MEFKIISANEYLKSNEKPEQEEVWDSIAKPWKIYVVKKIPIVVNFIKEKKGRVLDLGCGTGRNMIFNKDVVYYGVDFSGGQIKQAEKHIEKNKINAELFKISVLELVDKFGKEFFDYGLFIATLHCIESAGERKKVLNNFYKVLKKGAEGLISVWNSEDKRFDCVGNSGDIYMSWLENGKPYMRYYYLFKKQEFFNLIKKSGFKILEFYKPQEHDRFSKKNWIVRVRKV